MKTTRRFQSTDHVIYTVETDKWALSAMDTKRAWIDKNRSLPYAHHSLPEEHRALFINPQRGPPRYHFDDNVETGKDDG